MSLEDQIRQLEAALAALESQRAVLGDAAVDLSAAALGEKLAQLRPPAASPPSGLGGERKLVTVMFADLSGFTALSEKLDPEQVRAMMNGCFDRLVPSIERYGGTVDNFIGAGS